MRRTPVGLSATIGLALALGSAAPARAAETPDAGGVTRLSRLQGSASLGRNRHVVGATVLVREGTQTSHVYVTASDSKGRFRVDGLPDGDYRVEIRREGLRSVVKEDVRLRFPSRAVLEVTMEPSATASAPIPAPPGGASLDEVPRVSIHGEMLERGGGPMAEVALRFVRADGRADPIVVHSDRKGAFELPELPVGPWRLETRVVGFLPIWVTAEVREDMRLTVSMVRQPAGYEPSPLELMPAEQLIPPVRFQLQDKPPPVAEEEAPTPD